MAAEEFRPISPPHSEKSSVYSEATGDASPQSVRYVRVLGDTEASYYLPSRENGVNDMYLHLGLRAPRNIFHRARVAVVWAIMRLKHPLWASKVEMHDYHDLRFVYTSHTSAKEALADANQSLEYRAENKSQLLDSYLNGPRTLSNERLTYLIVSCPLNSIPSPPPTPDTARESFSGETVPVVDDVAEHDLMLCVAHFVGDGMALHTFANEFLTLLGSSKSEIQLEDMLESEWHSRWATCTPSDSTLPRSIEERLPPAPPGKMRKAASQIDFELSQSKLIGGHSFPRAKSATRQTIVPTVSIDEERTKKMLKTCKSHGVSISAALFAVANFAWAKTVQEKRDLPIMIYSAINLRPYLRPSPVESYCFLSIGYFNVVLPSFFPITPDGDSEVLSPAGRSMFWHRAKLAKKQSAHAGTNPMVVSRSRLMAEERGNRARMWAKEDDEKANGTWTSPPARPSQECQDKTKPSKPPSAALIGLSLLGNLDGMYKHASFADIRLHTLTTGSRQRSGGMLLFGYTFVGKLWVSLGYDENGFDKDVVDRFWQQYLKGVYELLVE